MADVQYKAVKISRGSHGWGGPLVIAPTSERNKIVSVTGGSISPIAQRIAEMTGCTVVDGFRTPPAESEWACVVVDCGGTARCGVYPRKRIPTINVTPVGQAGPLAQFITEDIYVSGVTVNDISYADGSAAATVVGGGEKFMPSSSAPQPAAAPQAPAANGGGFIDFISRFGRGIGFVVGTFFNAGRKTIDQIIRNVLPFMAFVTMLIGIILYTGIGDVIARPMGGLANNVIGLLVISAICGLPFLSPILGPGAVIAQVIGVAIIGPQVASGNIAPAMSLPALFAYNTQVGCDFVPVGLALGEAQPKTIEIGVPAVLFSRQIMGPVSVLIAWAASFFL
jgi:PTS system glucitol/sorbitol-specific IIC component